MRFRILGPLDLTNGAGPVSLDAPKQRALLGVLLLHPNEAVSSERLIDELWGERPPATAAKILQTYVSQLRRLVGAGTIATRPPGYLLRIDEEGLDATQFRRLAAEGRRLAASGDHERASTLYREALALWRGPPLADVVFESFARNEVERLEEERISVVIDLIDCELTLCRHEEVVQELETLVRQYPLRERLRAQLMLALYRSGRQADALSAYRDGRRTLADELGLEPGRELQELEKAILIHDPSLDTTTPPARAPARRPRPRWALRWRAAALVAAIGLALALALAFGLSARRQPSPRLAPNSVGLIDAKSGRVTSSFPVGRAPSALTVADNSVWVANYRDATVTRIDRATGHSVTIPVGGHPTGIAALGDAVWVWTLEGLLVPIDPRYDSAGKPLSFAAEIAGARGSEIGPQTLGGRVTAGAGFLWIAAPPTTVIRVDAATPRNRLPPIVPDEGVQGAISYHDGQVWVAGAYEVFPITAETGIPDTGASVGVVRDLAFGAGSLWVVSGGPAHVGGVSQALRRLDPHTGLVQATIPVGSDPVAVAVAGGSVWVAARTDGTIERVDPKTNRVVDTIAVGAKPIALAPEDDGVWVAVR
jgi:DNA-binding SARP family transcriptional activator/DNA-binding beta-propeller fold protein YncE